MAEIWEIFGDRVRALIPFLRPRSKGPRCSIEPSIIYFPLLPLKICENKSG